MIDWTTFFSLLDGAGVPAAPLSCVLTTHINPDGDAIGSELALAGWLEARGHAVRIVNSDPVPARYCFLDPEGRVETWDPDRHAEAIRSAGLAIILDVGRYDRLGAVGAALDPFHGRRICIDHHPVEVAIEVDLAIIDPTASATGELLFEMMAASDRPPDATIARALYVAVMTDTGSFRYGNTTSRTHRIAAELLQYPVDTAGIYETIYERSREARLRLLGHTLLNMEVLAGGAVVLLSITQENMRQVGSAQGDAEGFVEIARGMDGCRIAAVFTEIVPGQVKVSLRSKGTVDVNRLARKWGGGGHRNAAGIPAQPGFDSVRAAVALALVEAAGSATGA